MGQYYTPVILNAQYRILGSAYSHDYGNGLKLMEHSYVGNVFVNRIAHELLKTFKRVVWAGDYADNEIGKDVNLNTLADAKRQYPVLTFSHDVLAPYKYILNDSKRVAVLIPDIDTHEYAIHPLPLLTADGNGRGGGDYRGDNPHVGTWARDLIKLSKTLPKEYELLDINFELA